jgi:hypothetical protein
MTATRTTKGQRILDRVRPAVITAIGLCLANYGRDFLMDRDRIENDRERCSDRNPGCACRVLFAFVEPWEARFREREGANHPDPGTRPGREALGVVATSALSEERMARLQGIDEATDRIDDMLTDLISHPKPRDRLADQVPKDSSWAGQMGL